jgi:polyisoprenoid-binding protein YceI
LDRSQHRGRLALAGRSVALAVLLVSPLAILAGSLPAAEAAEPPWRVEKGEVRVTVPLRPGGAFDARGSGLTGAVTPAGARPVKLDGELGLDLTSLDTGIALRNQHLREKYLEVAKGRGFDRAVLSEITVNDAAGPDFDGRSAFGGSLLLHGVKRAVSGTAEIHRAGSGARVEASFPLTLTDFGIEPPEYLGVGVANKVIVRIQLSVAPSRGTNP